MAVPRTQAPIHVLGCGSIGLLFASSVRMAFPSFPLTMLLRSRHRPRIRPRAVMGDGQSQRRQNEGFVLASLVSPTSHRFALVELPAEIILDPAASIKSESSPIRNLILSTKAPDAASALRSVVHRLDPSGADVVILTNGALAVRDEVEGVLEDVGRRHAIHPDSVMKSDAARGDGAVHLILASTTHGAHRGMDQGVGSDGNESHDGVYRVVHAGVGRTYVQSQYFADLFDAAGLQAEYATPSEMYVLLWKKLATNCAINPLTALRGCSNGELLFPPDSGTGHVYDDDRAVIDAIIREVSEVAIAEARSAVKGIETERVAEVLGFDALRKFVADVIRDTAANKSSMLQDVLANRHPTEIRYLNGYLAKIGKEKHGIDAPANADICKRVERLTEDFGVFS